MRMGRERQKPLPLRLPPEEAGGDPPSPPRQRAPQVPGPGAAMVGRGGALWDRCAAEGGGRGQAGVCVGSGSCRGFFGGNARGGCREGRVLRARLRTRRPDTCV